MNTNKQNLLPNYVLGGEQNRYTNKAMSMSVNDHKKLITLVEGRFGQFISRNKGTDLSSPEAIIKVLNSKPRSFLRVLQNLVLPLKKMDQNIKNMCTPSNKAVTKVGKPKTIVKGYGKRAWRITIPSLNVLKGRGQNLDPKKLASLTKDLTASQSSVAKLDQAVETKYDLLTNKINSLTQVLKDNKLPMPLNLLKPLAKNELKPSTSTNSKYTAVTYLADLMAGKIESFTPVKNLNSANSPLQDITPKKYLGMFTPVSFINPFQQNIHFNFNAANDRKGRGHNLFDLLEFAFRAMSCLISKPVYTETPDKIKINLFYYLVVSASAKRHRQNILKKIRQEGANKKIATSINGIEIKNVTQLSEYAAQVGFGEALVKNNKGQQNNGKVIKSNNSFKLMTQRNLQKLNLLCLIISRIFKKPVELDLIRLHLPYFDDNILVKAIGIMTKKIPVRNIFKFIFSKTLITTFNKSPLKKGTTGDINSVLAGIKIKVGGRLMTQRIVPRLSSRVTQKGAVARAKINYINSSRVNLKNRRGAHSVTVTMSHLI